MEFEAAETIKADISIAVDGVFKYSCFSKSILHSQLYVKGTVPRIEIKS
jgi:hypothetical protein